MIEGDRETGTIYAFRPSPRFVVLTGTRAHARGDGHPVVYPQEKGGKKMKKMILLTSLLLTGCSSVGTVLPISVDTYTVSSSGHYQSWTDLKTLCVQRANEFCAAQ